jgi:hypothetical protein
VELSNNYFTATFCRCNCATFPNSISTSDPYKRVRITNGPRGTPNFLKALQFSQACQLSRAARTQERRLSEITSGVEGALLCCSLTTMGSE